MELWTKTLDQMKVTATACNLLHPKRGPMFVRILIPALFLSATPALAGLEFCNKTDVTASVAIGYKGDAGWTSEGWWNVDAGECKTVVSGDLDKSHYYWRSEAKGLTWKHEKYMFCTTSDEFTIVGDEDCVARGYEREEFNEIELAGKTSYTMNLTGSSSPSSASETTSKAPQPEPVPEPKPTPVAEDAPGTYGEPYSIAGVLSHCDWYDAGMGCTVVADGWTYVASSYDHTKMSTLEFLEQMPPNSPVVIRGDMISYEGAEAIVTIREWDIGSADAYQGYRVAIQGYWTSEDDPDYQVLIHGSSYEEYYGNIPQDYAFMHFTDQCEASPGGSPAFNIVRRDGSSDVCMYLSGWTDTTLELFPAGSMKPLYFYKAN